MVPLLLIKPNENRKPFLSNPVSNVVPWEAENRASYSSRKGLPVVPESTCQLPLPAFACTSLPRNPPFTRFLLPSPLNCVTSTWNPLFPHVYDLPPNKSHNSGPIIMPLLHAGTPVPRSHTISPCFKCQQYVFSLRHHLCT